MTQQAPSYPVMMQVVRVHTPGTVAALKLETVTVPKLQAGQVLVRNQFAGLNYLDIYHREGTYPVPYPAILGIEGGGYIAALGPSGLEAYPELAVGTAVAYFASSSYAEYTVVDASKALVVPAGVKVEVAVAGLVQGMTAQYLSRSACPLRKDDWCVVHAAAGGTGQLLVQAAKLLGAHVVATSSTPEKLALLSQPPLGADVACTYGEVVAKAKAATGGKGVKVVYDSVGKATWQASLDCLAQRGMLVLYGWSSGAVPPIDPAALAQRGSLFLTCPGLFDYAREEDELKWRAKEVFHWIATGRLKVTIDKVFPLAEVAKAHQYMESRQTKGKVLFQI